MSRASRRSRKPTHVVRIGRFSPNWRSRVEQAIPSCLRDEEELIVCLPDTSSFKLSRVHRGSAGWLLTEGKELPRRAVGEMQGRPDLSREASLAGSAGVWIGRHARRGRATRFCESRGVRISRSLVIGVEPDAVFRWIEEPELASQWQPDVAGYEITRRCGDVVGTEFRGGSAKRRGQNEAARSHHCLRPERADRVRSCWTRNPGTGGRLSWVVEPLVRRRIARQLDAELERLRGLAESS